MKRMIDVSTDVYAAIWAARLPGEDSENAVLSRIFNCSGGPIDPAPAVSSSGGVYDSRNGVTFPEGTRIFRNYKGAKYEATAKGGVWVRGDNGRAYPTLNQLNGSIASGSENVWNGNWKYRDAKGVEKSIDTLRQ